jgi:hypothetical protein
MGIADWFAPKPDTVGQTIAMAFYHQRMGCANCGSINWFNITSPAATANGSWRYFRRCRSCKATGRFKATNTGEGWLLTRA